MADSLDRIAAWFAARDGDGEFVRNVDPLPRAIFDVATGARRIIYTTKPRLFAAAIERLDAPSQVGVIGRYGLPTADDLRRISEIAVDAPIVFLGDLDPPDLLIYAWLRGHLHPRKITHAGVNDRLLAALRIVVIDSILVPAAPSEIDSLAFLKDAFPNCADATGVACAQIIQRGFKLELEALVSARNASAVLQAVTD
jgi:hypothetical protein